MIQLNAGDTPCGKGTVETGAEGIEIIEMQPNFGKCY